MHIDIGQFFMKQLIIKIGVSMNKDLKEIFHNPRKGILNSHTIYLKTPYDLYEIFSPKRIELLKYLISHKSEKNSITTVSKELKRKQEAISRDAKLLETRGFIEKIKEKKSTYLKTNYNSLQIILEN